MENQPPTTNASAWLNRKPAAPDEGESELARLKERLGFYESFDRLIQDNVSRAGELLRHAATMRENAEQELAQARREMEELRSGDRQEYRSLLSGLLDDVTTMQVQIERLARRVADALDDLEVTLPAGSSIGRLSATSTIEPPPEPAPQLPIEPTMDELLPPEPDGEAAHGAQSIEPAGDVEAEVIVAEIETAEASGIAPESDADYLVADDSTPEIATAEAGTESSDAILTEAPEPDTELIVEEVVQGPSDIHETPIDGGAAQEQLGDGVLTGGTITGDASSRDEDVAPPAPAEENVVGSAPDQTADDLSAAAVAEPSSPEPAPSRLPWISSDVRPFSVEGIAGTGIRRPVTGDLRMPEPAARASTVSATLMTGAGVATAVLVHGVPRATTALSLKRYLESLPHVGAVEPREYAEGILRLHVTGQRSLNIDDLRGWSDGSNLEPVHLRDDLIEVRLSN